MVITFFAPGFEEIEAITPVDLLRRAGVEVITAGVNSREITGARGIAVVADITAAELVLSEDIEAIILPGGMPGTVNLEKSQAVSDAIDYCFRNNKLICAICAAPSILGHKGLAENKKVTCYPGYEKQMRGAVTTGEDVVCDGQFITARGAGVSAQFALAIIEKLISAEKAREIKEAIRMS